MSLVEVVVVLGFLSVGCHSQVMFTTQPQSANITEGGDVTFQCSAEEGGSTLTSGWQFTPEGSADVMTLVTGTILTGIEMVTVSGGLRTMLTFSGVRREANRGTVVCLVVGNVPTLSNLANLTVWWNDNITINTDPFSGDVTVGNNIIVDISLDANPTPSISLVNDGTGNVVPEARYNASGNDTVGRIVFGPLNTTDTGNYTVVVSNVARSQTQAFSLSVVSGGGPKGLSAGAIAAMVVCSLVFMALGN